MKEFYVQARMATIIASGVIGAVAGAATWGLKTLVERFFVEPVFCRSADSFSLCSNGGTLAFNIALVIMALVAVVALVRAGGYRPLLVAIAAVATLWSANTWLGVQVWWEAAIWLSILSAIAYLIYSWIARISMFAVSVVLMIVIIVVARLVVASA